MLTKTDLQAIKKVIRSEVETEGKNTKDKISEEIRTARMRIQIDIKDLQDRVKNLEVRVNDMEKEIRKEFIKTRKEISLSVDFLDKDYLRLKQKVEKIEKRVQATPV